ncbi:hypothetical protein K458DRAFT_397587 [Lentithecium fluviatile CBS 122367]|uniref:Uncharacterized protein n=1 Tax=Lentithecium fluviatile CBS 122367 TaxID=1168545 RepID=A0A6G1ICH4_9PLEO|nr:hypothetical protein K458DRAFT_397587 [Lentithecium fluviatile CBS 122367]
MRHIPSFIFFLSVLLVLFKSSDGRALTSIQCPDGATICNIRANWTIYRNSTESIIRWSDYLSNVLLKRAGGGGKSDGPPSPNNSPNGPTGEDGMWDENNESEGGFGTCTKKRSWLFWRRSDCAPEETENVPPPADDSENTPPPANPETDTQNPPPANDPSLADDYDIATNNGEPMVLPKNWQADLQESLRNLHLTLDNQKSEFLNQLRQKGLNEDGPWVFYSGLEAGATKNPAPGNANAIIKQLASALSDEDEEITTLVSFSDLSDSNKITPWRTEVKGQFGWCYFSVSSKAIAQIAKGDIYLIIHKGAPVSNAYRMADRSHPSYFWTYEAPELTRREEVKRIIRVQVALDGDFEIDQIWTKGDAPWGSQLEGCEWQMGKVPPWDFYPPGKEVEPDS